MPLGFRLSYNPPHTLESSAHHWLWSEVPTTKWAICHQDRPGDIDWGPMGYVTEWSSNGTSANGGLAKFAFKVFGGREYNTLDPSSKWQASSGPFNLVSKGDRAPEFGCQERGGEWRVPSIWWVEAMDWCGTDSRSPRDTGFQTPIPCCPIHIYRQVPITSGDRPHVYCEIYIRFPAADSISLLIHLSKSKLWPYTLLITLFSLF